MNNCNLKMNREYLQNLKAETEKKALDKAIADAADELTARILDFASTSKARKMEINVFTLMSNLKTHFSKCVLPILKERFGDVEIVLRTMEYVPIEKAELVGNTEYRGYGHDYNLEIDWS